MRQQLRDLYEIQKIDLDIRELEKQYETIPAQLQTLEAAERDSAQEIEQLEELRRSQAQEITGLEGLIQAENHKIRKWESRLNDIRNQREYVALSREIEGSRRGNRDNENKLLELMKAQEEADNRFAALETQLADQKEALGTERQQVEAAYAEVRTQVTEKKARREVLVPKVPATLTKRYESIRRRRLGVGLVLVVGGSCTGCHMKLPPQLYNVLQRGDSIEQCPSCSRLVLWDQHLAPELGDEAVGIEADLAVGEAGGDAGSEAAL